MSTPPLKYIIFRPSELFPFEPSTPLRQIWTWQISVFIEKIGPSLWSSVPFWSSVPWLLHLFSEVLCTFPLQSETRSECKGRGDCTWDHVSDKHCPFFLKWSEISRKRHVCLDLGLFLNLTDTSLGSCVVFRSGGEFRWGFQGWGKLKKKTDLQESQQDLTGLDRGTRRSFLFVLFLATRLSNAILCTVVSVSSLSQWRVVWGSCSSYSLQLFLPCYWTWFLCSLAETISGINICYCQFIFNLWFYFKHFNCTPWSTKAWHRAVRWTADNVT